MKIVHHTSTAEYLSWQGCFYKALAHAVPALHPCRLWNDAFNVAQDYIGLPRGTIRGTVLIETILAAFEMEEILYELRQHSSGVCVCLWETVEKTVCVCADLCMILSI